MEWNESTFNINICDYTREAASVGKWAFVSDYARFWILYNYGGVYFDTDVEVIREIDDNLLNSCFMGKETSNHKENKKSVAAGLGLSANAGRGHYKEIVDYYSTQHFLYGDGTMNLESVVDRVTNILVKYGYKGNDEKEIINNIITIYPPEFFCPMNPDDGVITITGNTISIHHYADSWHNSMEKKAIALGRRFENKGRLVYFSGRLITLPIR